MTLLDEPVEEQDDLGSVIEALTDEEAALAAILLDPSGLDQAEFLLTDQSKPDLCYRAKPFQTPWWRNRDARQVDRCSRDVGKCLDGSALISLSDGTRARIDSLLDGADELTLGGDWRIHPSKALVVAPTGVREVVQITTRLGFQLRCSLEHQLRTFHGWRAAADIDVGSRIAVVRTVPEPAEPRWLPEYEVRLMAHLICDAKTTQNTPHYTKGDYDVVEDLVDAASRFPSLTTTTSYDSARHAWDVLLVQTVHAGFQQKSPITLWLEQHDLKHRSRDKTIPEVVFRLSRHQLALFLGRLFSGDGCVEKNAVTYSSASEPLARDVHYLLRRFGVVASIRKKQSTAIRGGPLFDSWELRIPPSSLDHFADTIGRHIVGPKGGRLAALLSRIHGHERLDRIPHDVWTMIDAANASRPRPLSARAMGIPDRGASRNGLSRESVVAAGQCLGVPELLALGTSDVTWDEVAEIRPLGVRPVYDIEMVDEPNFVADGLIVHNSERMMLRVLAFPFVQPGEEMSIFTPEHTHIDKIAERIEMRITTNWFYRSLTRPGRSGITHRPFKCLWANGSRLISSLPQRSGIGAKGTHSVEVHIEEAQDLSPQAWAEIPNTISWEKPGAAWHIHGVSKGVRDAFYDYSTKPELGFTVHQITQMHREDWSEERRQQLIEEFGGSADSPDYRRNVCGAHGDTANVVFILSRLMSGVDTDESSHFNLTEYQHYEVRGPELQSRVEAMGTGAGTHLEDSSEQHTLAVQQMLDFPMLHRERYEVFWAGMDVGLVDDPSEILIFAEYHPSADERRANRAAKLGVPLDGRSRLKLVTRISMRWIPAPLQADVIMWVIEEYKPRAFSMDSTGNGLPVFQELQKRAGSARMRVMDYSDDGKIPIAATDARTRRQAQAREALTTIKGYNFSGKVIVGFDDAKVEAMPAGATPQEVADEAGLKTWVKQGATDFLRGIVDTQRHLLPYDKELLRQFNAQTWQYGAGGVDAYGRRKTYSNVKVHTLDAARMAILGRELEPIEQFLREPPKKARPVFDYFVEA